MKFLTIAAFAVLGICTSGCATIIEGTTQSIAITTPPTEGAKCEMTNSEGTWYITSPGSATVHKTKTDLNVVCTKLGFQDARATISSDFKATTLGNIILGGVIGVGVDAASGAMNEYPKTFQIPMTPVTQHSVPATSPSNTNGKPMS